jgi:hypothetical protein
MRDHIDILHRRAMTDDAGCLCKPGSADRRKACRRTPYLRTFVVDAAPGVAAASLSSIVQRA